MSNYEFGNALYRTEREMLDAAVQTYLTADGANDEEFIEDTLNAHDDEALADDLERQWRIDADPEELIAAFARSRETFPQWM
jgi:hypothetical protein